MSEENIFQPRRKPITPADINGTEALEASAKVRASLAEDDTTANKPKPMQDGQGPIKMSGNIPPQLLQMMAKTSAKKTGEVPFTSTGNDKLDEVLIALKQKNNIYEKITLPSKGKFYDGTNGPIDGVLHVRPMTGEEEQILATPRFVKKGEAMNMIFNRCIREEFDSSNLLTQDRTFILIYLRGISYSPEYDVQIKCPTCDRKFAHTIDLAAIEKNECPDNFSSANLKDKLPSSGLNFSYRLATGSDEQIVQSYRDKKTKNFDTSNSSDDTLLYRTSIMVNDIEGITDKREIQTILANLPIGDLNYLRSTISDAPFGVDTKIDISCPSCFADFEMELPLETSFFFPARNRNKE